MAIYRIFPEKDTFIFSENSTANAGRDEIVEIGGYPGTIDGTGQASRILTKFSDEDIEDVVDNKIGNTNFSSSLKLYLASANDLPVDYITYAYPTSTTGTGEWDNGTGKFGDLPVNRTGASWIYKNSGQSNAWNTSGLSATNTGSLLVLFPIRCKPEQMVLKMNWYQF